MYAKNNGVTSKADITDRDGLWRDVVIKDIVIKGGSAEIGFYADGKAAAWCRVDDVELVRTGDIDDDTATEAYNAEERRTVRTEYFTLDGKALSNPGKVTMIKRKTFNDNTQDSKVIHKGQ